jgi:signal transduction histidine kinase
MWALCRQNLHRFAAALSRNRSRDRDAAVPGDERVARMGAVLTGAVHELCSPLTTIAVLVEELRQQPNLGDRRELADSLRIMSDQIDACRSIVSRLAQHGGRVASSGRDAYSLRRDGAATQAEQQLSARV